MGGTSELCKVLLRVIGLASTPAAKRSDVSTIVATVIDAVVHTSISCSSMRSTATVMIAPALTAHMIGTVLGDAFGSVR